MVQVIVPYAFRREMHACMYVCMCVCVCVCVCRCTHTYTTHAMGAPTRPGYRAIRLSPDAFSIADAHVVVVWVGSCVCAGDGLVEGAAKPSAQSLQWSRGAPGGHGLQFPLAC